MNEVIKGENKAPDFKLKDQTGDYLHTREGRNLPVSHCIKVTNRIMQS